ncbi:MAG: hypothetical protein WAV90_02545 [Gordonia amarae]
MINPDKILSQSQAYEAVPSFTAMPLEGPGRWAHLPEDVILYTDDEDKLFIRYVSYNVTVSDAVQAISRLHDEGLTATEAFDLIRSDAPVITGDLAELVLIVLGYR